VREPTPRWSRLDHDERRGQILAVARKLFSERSYAEVSAEEIAAAAGVRRGLLHHYFGGKRGLLLDVVRDVVGRTALPLPEQAADAPIEVLVGACVDGWLDLVQRDARLWFAVLGAEGFGSDPELVRIVADATDATVERIIEVLGAAPSPELRAVLRTYSGLAGEATREWLVRRSLTRAQTHALLSAALLALVRDVAPAVVAAGTTSRRSSTRRSAR
jgi:AcrR family transcriptional regulator